MPSVWPWAPPRTRFCGFTRRCVSRSCSSRASKRCSWRRPYRLSFKPLQATSPVRNSMRAKGRGVSRLYQQLPSRHPAPARRSRFHRRRRHARLRQRRALTSFMCVTGAGCCMPCPCLLQSSSRPLKQFLGRHRKLVAFDGGRQSGGSRTHAVCRNWQSSLWRARLRLCASMSPRVICSCVAAVAAGCPQRCVQQVMRSPVTPLAPSVARAAFNAAALQHATCDLRLQARLVERVGSHVVRGLHRTGSRSQRAGDHRPRHAAAHPSAAARMRCHWNLAARGRGDFDCPEREGAWRELAGEVKNSNKSVDFIFML